jgi:hypothetical protein
MNSDSSADPASESKSGSSPIADNPSFQDLAKSADQARAIAFFCSLAKKAGLKTPAFDSVADAAPKLGEQMKQLGEFPDRFNAQFSARGWAAHESMNVEVSKRAVEAAEAGDSNAGEEILIAHYDINQVDFVLFRCKWMGDFSQRWELAQRAKEDYLAERYYAAVPLILMVIDGFVNDIAQTGFFTDRTDMTAWDSIAGHSSGLKKLGEIFNASRTKTTTDTISLPYRHGIIHGRDLGYGSKAVAAKCWAALSAIADWAVARERNKTSKPKKAEKPWSEVLDQIKENAETERRMREWVPRELRIGVNITESGSPADYAEGSPEQTVGKFFEYWRRNNYGMMASLVYDAGSRPLNERAGDVRARFHSVRFKRFAIVEFADVAPGAADTIVAVTTERDGKEKITRIALRLIYQSDDGTPKTYPTAGANWTLMDIGFSSALQ